ncbi:MAG: hypothetical protein RLZZ205_565 [Bacteroidota bacterium]|jgi:hypothetical protein
MYSSFNKKGRLAAAFVQIKDTIILLEPLVEQPPLS